LLNAEGKKNRELSEWRIFVRAAYRDPEHFTERLALHSIQSLGAPSDTWAHDVREQRAEVPRPVVAEELRRQSAQAASIEGAITGTPFLLALVPGYLAYLRQEARMLLRTAALYGRDPLDLQTGAEMLALRGVHPTVAAARSSLLAVQGVPLPEKPTKRRPLRIWVRSVYRLLIFGGFVSAPSDKSEEVSHPYLKTSLAVLIGATIWAITWIFPVSFMLAMAWGCGTNARQLGRRALIFYEDEPDSAKAAIAAAKERREPGYRKRQAIHATLFILSVAIPIGFIAYVDHQRQSGITGLTVIGSLVALALVIAIAALASRR
jgi:hypothetical protein